MKKQWIIIVLLGWIFGLSAKSIAQPALSDETPQNGQAGKIHSLHLGYSQLMYQDAYKIFTKMPMQHFTLTYTKDIPWRYERPHLFVVAGCGYSGGSREKGPYQSSGHVVFDRYFYDQIHVYSGVGVRIDLPYSLYLSFSEALDLSLHLEVGSYPSYHNRDLDYAEGIYYVKRSPYGDLGIHSQTSLFLTYEIKNVLISAGCQAYFGFYVLDNKPAWQYSGLPSCLWATLGVGYRF